LRQNGNVDVNPTRCNLPAVDRLIDTIERHLSTFNKNLDNLENANQLWSSQRNNELKKYIDSEERLRDCLHRSSKLFDRATVFAPAQPEVQSESTVPDSDEPTLPMPSVDPDKPAPLTGEPEARAHEPAAHTSIRKIPLLTWLNRTYIGMPTHLGCSQTTFNMLACSTLAVCTVGALVYHEALINLMIDVCKFALAFISAAASGTIGLGSLLLITTAVAGVALLYCAMMIPLMPDSSNDGVCEESASRAASF
jgi:hypothetical protein